MSLPISPAPPMLSAPFTSIERVTCSCPPGAWVPVPNPMTCPPKDPLVRTWLLLAALSAAGTALTFVPPAGAARWITGLVFLALALAKSRLILLSYLGLASAPAWRGGILGSVTLSVLLFAGLYLAG